MATINSDSVAQDQIRAFVDRILRLKEEAASIKGDIREVYAEAKGNGFDKTVLGKVVGYVEKRAAGANDLAEAEALFDLYLSAYDGASVSHTHAYTREDDFAGEQQGAARPQHRSSETTGAVPTKASAGANTGGENVAAHQLQTTTDVLKNDDGKPGDGWLAPISDVEPVAPFPEPVIVSPPSITATGDGDSTDSSPDAVPGATNVTPFRTHNPETHFLNSKGLQRLHGCLNAEMCAGSRSKLCFTCSTQHEGPAHVGGAA